MRVLAGDIGGTKVLLQIAQVQRGALEVVAEWRVESAVYGGLLPIVQEFVQTVGVETFSAACFGIAGPIAPTAEGQQARVTNLPWVIDSRELERALAIPRVRLINDFQALAYGIETLTADDLVDLQTATARARAPCAVIGAGTGLGQGLLVWEQDHYEALPTEGGHVDFAPTEEIQVELYRHLAARFGRVSYERVLSGPGLVNIYTFLCAHRRVLPVNAVLESPDPAAAISEAALAASDPIALESLELFVRIYGAQAGNIALACLAFGGVYIGGGIAPKILPVLRSADFTEAFLAKGRMAPLLAAMPVRVITNPKTGLYGAVRAASRL